MSVGSLVRLVTKVFGVHRRLDYVLKPLFVLTSFGTINAALLMGLLRTTSQEAIGATAMAIMSAIPFVAVGYAVMLHQHRRHKSLSNAVQTDDLTGLPNRGAFRRRSEAALKNGRNGFFLIIDADRFKTINDTLGHPSGDVCLQAIADRLKSILRDDDLIGRIGGEEFGMILFDRTMEELQRTASRMCYPIKVTLPDHPETLRLTVSAGATEMGAEDTISKLTTRADDALLVAKNNGRERMVLWRPAIKKTAA